MKLFTLIISLVFSSFTLSNQITVEEVYQKPHFKQAIQAVISATVKSTDPKGKASEGIILAVQAMQQYPDITPKELKNIFTRSLIDEQVDKELFFYLLNSTHSKDKNVPSIPIDHEWALTVAVSEFPNAPISSIEKILLKSISDNELDVERFFTILIQKYEV